MARPKMAYGTPAAYSSLVAPRYAPIATALLARASSPGRASWRWEPERVCYPQRRRLRSSPTA
jgi:hypothetical protein